MEYFDMNIDQQTQEKFNEQDFMRSNRNLSDPQLESLTSFMELGWEPVGLNDDGSFDIKKVDDENNIIQHAYIRSDGVMGPQ